MLAPPPPQNRRDRGRNRTEREQRSLFSAVKPLNSLTRLPSNMSAFECCTLFRKLLIEATLGPHGRPQGFLGFASFGPDEERVEEVFLRRYDRHPSPESTYLSQGQGRLGGRTDREREDPSVPDTCSRDSLSPEMGSSRRLGSSRDFAHP